MAAISPLAHLSVDERVARGRAARELRPRGSLAAWRVPLHRAEPIDLLAGQETDRVPVLLPVRHFRTAASPFAFYRGSAIVMAADLGSMPTSGLTVQLCGDAHLANFGVFRAPDRRLVFDGDDFEIYLYDGLKTVKLTQNNYDDVNPDLHDGIITWMGYELSLIHI